MLSAFLQVLPALPACDGISFHCDHRKLGGVNWALDSLEQKFSYGIFVTANVLSFFCIVLLCNTGLVKPCVFMICLLLIIL